MPELLGSAKSRGFPHFFRPPAPVTAPSQTKGKHPDMARNKIALIGSGMIGGTLAHMIGLK
ncbi:MAG: hypothetical protein E5X98_20340, partial [Mesorhizobium sp.]